MIIPAAKIIEYMPVGTITMSVRQQDGSPCRRVSVAELRHLISVGHVEGVVRGSKLCYVRLLASPDVAFRDHKQRGALDWYRTDANVTVVRSDPGLPPYLKAHHEAHCQAWPTNKPAGAC